jgi:hypothetical protein
MSRVTDTAARILANVDGETKQESHGADEAMEVFQAVAGELLRRVDAMRAPVEALRRTREEMVKTTAERDAEQAEMDREEADAEEAERGPAAGPAVGPSTAVGGPNAEPATPDSAVAPTPAEGAKDTEPVAQAEPVPAVSQPENTPSSRTEPAPITMTGAESTNDI